MNRFGRVSAAVGVAVMAAAVWGLQAWMSGNSGPPAAAHSRVIVASLLAAPGERGSEAAHAFDRLRIPSDATEMQLSFATDLADLADGAAAAGTRFETELVAVDADADGGGDVPPKIYATTIEPGPAGAMARVVVPAPPDGDYVLRLLRLRQDDGARKEVVVTKAFRLMRGPHGRVR